MEAKIQFIKGLDEKVLPDVRLTRSRDGSTGTATFRFKNPNILDKNTAKEGEITGMYLIDEEGILETRVNSSNSLYNFWLFIKYSLNSSNRSESINPFYQISLNLFSQISNFPKI